MFEIQVKTLGYVGLGFTRDDGTVGADMVIGWVDNNGQLHLQVSVLKSVTLFPSRSLTDDGSSFLNPLRPSAPKLLMLEIIDGILHGKFLRVKKGKKNK